MSGDRLDLVQGTIIRLSVNKQISDKEQGELEALVEIAKAAREQADAVKAILGTLNFYIGPNARTAVSRESVASYERLRDANNAQFAALARLDNGATEGDA